MKHRFRPCNAAMRAAAIFAAAATFPTQTSAQSSDTDFQLLNQIYEASNSVESGEPETARAAYKTCTELGKELAARTDMEPAVKYSFEAEIESCLSYAMGHGEFTDETGDHCSHSYAAAEKFAAAILAAQNAKGVQQEQLTNLRERLQRLSETGPQAGCQGDYAKLTASLPATDAIASDIQPGIPNKQIMDEISSVTHAVTNKDSEAWLRACRRFSEGLAQRPELNPVERVYFEAIIENCISTTMARGNMSDETGDVCAHHHLFATKLAQALALDTKAAFLDPGFKEYVSEELKVAQRQGPGMGCKQDYASLKTDEVRP